MELAYIRPFEGRRPRKRIHWKASAKLNKLNKVKLFVLI